MIPPKNSTLTVGMATYDDFHGVWSTVKAIKIYLNRYFNQIVVVDNNPSSEHGKATKIFCDRTPGVKYVAFPNTNGPALAKQQVIKEAKGPHVLVIDSHVMLHEEGVRQLAEYWKANPDSKDLIQGPVVFDECVTIATQFDDVWPIDEEETIENGRKKLVRKPSKMWGRWGRDMKAFPKMPWEDQTLQQFTTEYNDKLGQMVQVPVYQPELPKATVEMFPIFAQGMGLFSTHKEHWLGFHDKFKGFGGEECYIHEKYRKAGRTCWCMSALFWHHRFANPDGRKFPNLIYDRFRNYAYGFRELGLDPKPLLDHFLATGLVRPEWVEAAFRGDPEPPTDELIVFEKDGCGRPGGGCGGAATIAVNVDEPLAHGDSLEAEFLRVYSEPSDINEHLPKLRELVETVGPSCRVVELGTRHGVSTTAFLAGKPALMRAVDINLTAGAMRLKRYADKATRYEIVTQESTVVPQVECDILFVDTDPHTEARVTAELNHHAAYVKRFIVFHDTAPGTFGEKYGNEPGIMPAVRKFLMANRNWTMIYQVKNNNGLTIISCDDRDKTKPPSALRAALTFGRALVKHAADMGRATSEPERIRRIELCVMCPDRFADVCGLCRCPVEKKASWASEDCPRGNWTKDEDHGGQSEKQ